MRLGPLARPHPYLPDVTPGIVSFLLGGAELPATRVLTRQLGPATVPELRNRFPSWRFDARHVRIEALIGRTVIRIRSSSAGLDQPLPDPPVPDDTKRFVAADHPCPRCGKQPDRFRVLRDGGYVCILCGASSPAP